MVARRRSTRLSHTPGPPQTFLFGPAPILRGEDSEAYDNLLLAVSTAVKPIDAIEEILVSHFVNITWDDLRLDKIKTNLIAQARLEALEHIVKRIQEAKRLINYDPVEGAKCFAAELRNPGLSRKRYPRRQSTSSLVGKWAAGNPAAVRRVNKLLSWGNQTIESVMAKAFLDKIDIIERLENLTATREKRRYAILREIDRRRWCFAQASATKFKHVEESIETKGVDRKKLTIKKAA
jgi:hypothetical protein